MTLPNASRTAWDVKFSEGIRLIKCFCRLFSYMPVRQHAFFLFDFETISTYLLEYVVYGGICLF